MTGQTTHCPDGYRTCAVHNTKACDLHGQCRAHLAKKPVVTADDPRPAGEACECGHSLLDHAIQYAETSCQTGRCVCQQYRPAASGGATDGERDEYVGHVGSCRIFYAERRCTCGRTGYPVASQADERLRDALRIHHPIMRSETGPFSGCRCGKVRLGQDVIAHVSGELRRALDQP